jgi:hypothetical protein
MKKNISWISNETSEATGPSKASVSVEGMVPL